MTENALVPELSVRSCDRSLRFYTQLLGFTVVYRREEEGFAYLTLGDAQLMLDEIGQGRTWETERLERPLGRGINLQIRVAAIAPLLQRLEEAGVPLFLRPEEKWYRKDDAQVGNRQFLVQDPDGYLLRFFEDLGARSL